MRIFEKEKWADLLFSWSLKFWLVWDARSKGIRPVCYLQGPPVFTMSALKTDAFNQPRNFCRVLNIDLARVHENLLLLVIYLQQQLLLELLLYSDSMCCFIRQRKFRLQKSLFCGSFTSCTAMMDTHVQAWRQPASSSCDGDGCKNVKESRTGSLFYSLIN